MWCILQSFVKWDYCKSILSKYFPCESYTMTHREYLLSFFWGLTSASLDKRLKIYSNFAHQVNLSWQGFLSVSLASYFTSQLTCNLSIPPFQGCHNWRLATFWSLFFQSIPHMCFQFINSSVSLWVKVTNWLLNWYCANLSKWPKSANRPICTQFPPNFKTAHWRTNSLTIFFMGQFFSEMHDNFLWSVKKVKSLIDTGMQRAVLRIFGLCWWSPIFSAFLNSNFTLVWYEISIFGGSKAEGISAKRRMKYFPYCHTSLIISFDL